MERPQPINRIRAMIGKEARDAWKYKATVVDSTRYDGGYDIAIDLPERGLEAKKYRNKTMERAERRIERRLRTAEGTLVSGVGAVVYSADRLFTEISNKTGGSTLRDAALGAGLIAGTWAAVESPKRIRKWLSAKRAVNEIVLDADKINSHHAASQANDATIREIGITNPLAARVAEQKRVIAAGNR